jgi:hypothetical protein
MSQKDSVLSYLETGKSITSFYAIKNMGITRISAVIHKLKEEGYPVVRHDIPVTNRHGKPTIIGSWSLDSNVAHKANAKQHELAL